jgi:hypothetical protein
MSLTRTGIIMGIFDRLKGQAENEAEKDPNLASDPNQPGYQDPTQGGGFQNQNHDPNQPGYQDPTQSASQETGYDPDQDPYQDHKQGQ